MKNIKNIALALLLVITFASFSGSSDNNEIKNFIELSRTSNSGKILINVDHIISIKSASKYSSGSCRIQLTPKGDNEENGITVIESYEEVKKLIKKAQK